MKLRTILLSALLVAATAANAKTADELRIYVNPGHGSWTGGDRAMSTIKHGPYNTANPDTTGFFESNTNLWKCFGLVDKLEEYGLKIDRTLNQDNPNPARLGAALDMRNNIVMSHVKLGPYPVGTGDEEAYNRSLYEIACEVERNNFDFFISVHSNAHVDGNNTNYPALFVRGENKTASVEGSDDAVRTVWPFAYQDEHQCWSNYSMTSVALYYDIDFWNGDYVDGYIDGKHYKGYYGVLRHGVKGFLCEGYFHTYQPARHRAMNVDVCRHEGTGYAHGLAAVFGLETEKYGELYGIVRDLHERFKHDYYHCSATSPDAKMPINNAEVVLYKDGTEVSRYTTDDEWNGAFVFPRLEPGQYTIAVTAPGYKPAHEDYCGPFTVEASKTTYPRVYLESESYIPPAIQYYDYPDEAAGAKAIVPSDSYAFKRNITDKKFAALEGKEVRRVICRGDRLYVLAVDAERVPTVLVIDANRLTTLANLDVTGAEGTEYAISDIQVTSDGVLIGCAEELCHLLDSEVEEGETRGECNIYRWQNDDEGLPTGAPKIWFTTQMTGNLYKAWTGGSMAYSGTFDEGRMLLSSASFYYDHKIFFSIIDVVEGKKSSESFSNDISVCDYFVGDGLGHFTFTTSPVTPGSFITDSPMVQPRQYTIEKMHLEGEVSSDLIPSSSEQAGYFRYAGRSMMVAPSVDENGNNNGIRLFDISNGLDNARALNTTGTDLSADALSGAAAVGRTDVTFDDEGEVTGADMVMYIVRNGRISRFTTKGVEQPVVEPAYAYNLKSVPGTDGYDLSFNLTAPGKASILLTDVTDASNTVTLGAGSYDKGENTVAVSGADLAGNAYTWSVLVENESVGGVKTLSEVVDEFNGVTVDDNEASPYFGTVYTSLKSGSRGLYLYNPALESLNETPYQNYGWDHSVGASCWRLAPLPDGRIMVADWGDAQGGIYIFDPAQPETPVVRMFQGTQNPANGCITNAEGKIIAGSTSGMWAHNGKLYSFQEDYPDDYNLSMVAYDLPEDGLISDVPSEEFPVLSPYLINGNVNVYANDKALFLSQVRGAGNNAAGVPVFLIADYDSNILANSGKDFKDEINGGDGALAVNADGSIMAVTDATGSLHLFRITWEPVFKMEEYFVYNMNNTADAYQMAFDRAGRLYVATRSKLSVYAVPQPAAVVATAATDVLGKVDAVNEIEATDNAAPVEYYNLQGMRVNGNLAPGIYIRRQGTAVTKVLVK